MSFLLSNYLLRKFITSPGEALRLKRAGDEVRDYALWRLYTVLEESGLLAKLQEQSWWSFKDRDLAKMTCDILVGEGLAEWRGDTIRVVAAPRRPTITTKEAADISTAIDKALSYLPRAVETGEKPPLPEVRAAAVKFYDNFAARLQMEITLEETGLKNLGEDAVVADFLARAGASTAMLLERTKAKIIVVEPYPENIAVIKGLVKLMRQEDRVTYVQAFPEEVKLQQSVDAVFMSNVLNWTLNPRLALARAREALKEGGFLSMTQAMYAPGTAMLTALTSLLLGAVRPPPTESELRDMVRDAGFKEDKWLNAMSFLVARLVPA